MDTQKTINNSQKEDLKKAMQLLRDGLDLYENGLRYNVTKALGYLREVSRKYES